MPRTISKKIANFQIQKALKYFAKPHFAPFMIPLNTHRYSFLVTFLLIQVWAPAQTPKIDSLEKALSTVKNDSEKIEILNLLAESAYSKAPEKSISYSKQIITLADESNDSKNLMMGYKHLGIAQGFANDYETAIGSLLKSTELAEKNKYWSVAGENYTNIGSAYYVIFGNFDKAIEYYLKGLSAYERADDKKGIGAALSGIGISYTNEKKYNEALETLNRSLQLFEALKDDKEIAKVLVSIGGVYDRTNEYEKALSYYQRAFDLFERLKVTRGMARSLYAMGDIYEKQHEPEKAIDVLTRALVLNEQTNHQSSIVECLISLGKVYKDQGRTDLAEKNFLHAVDLSIPLKKKESLSDAYQKLAEIYDSRSDFKNAFKYQKLHTLYYDSVFNSEKSKQIAEMQTRFDSERKQIEIANLKEEKSMNQIFLGIAVGFVFLISLIGFLIINRQKLKIQKDRELAEKESQIMEERKTLFETELSNHQLLQEHLQSQLEFKNKELASYTLNLIQKNEILENVKHHAEEIKNAPENLIKQKLTGLINLVNYSSNLDKDWETFKLHFEQVHHNFFKKLLEKNPELTANDLKLCALIKLNLDNRGIATILNISQESAKVARHRLRKKLNLNVEENLIAYLNIGD